MTKDIPTFERQWSMPSKDTFSIPPINKLVTETFLRKSLLKTCVAVDPFVGYSPFADRCITNDLDPDIDAMMHIDALSFLRSFSDASVDIVLFDPPYSPRQVSEVYKKMSMSVNMSTTQASFWSNIKKQVARITKDGGIAITCGWNSGGIGKANGFVLEHILLVPHGGWHNDTIVTVEVKKDA